MNATIDASQIPAIRQWEGKPLSPAYEVFMFHDEEGPVPETYRRLRDHLTAEGIEHVFIGAFALSAHQYRRATEGVDVCLRAEDVVRLRERFVGSVYQAVEGRPRRFYDPQTQVTFDVLVAGQLAGRTARNNVIRFPDPDEGQIVHGIRTVSLPRLIELKLVTWRYQDWADVVKLIRHNRLSEEFAEQLHPLVRTAYLQCVDEMHDEDRYDREVHDQ